MLWASQPSYKTNPLKSIKWQHRINRSQTLPPEKKTERKMSLGASNDLLLRKPLINDWNRMWPAVDARLVLNISTMILVNQSDTKPTLPSNHHVLPTKRHSTCILCIGRFTVNGKLYWSTQGFSQHLTVTLVNWLNKSELYGMAGLIRKRCLWCWTTAVERNIKKKQIAPVR